MEGKVNEAAQVNRISPHRQSGTEMETGVTEQENQLLAAGETVCSCRCSAENVHNDWSSSERMFTGGLVPLNSCWELQAQPGPFYASNQ